MRRNNAQQVEGSVGEGFGYGPWSSAAKGIEIE